MKSNLLHHSETEASFPRRSMLSCAKLLPSPCTCAGVIQKLAICSLWEQNGGSFSCYRQCWVPHRMECQCPHLLLQCLAVKTWNWVVVVVGRCMLQPVEVCCGHHPPYVPPPGILPAASWTGTMSLHTASDVVLPKKHHWVKCCSPEVSSQTPIDFSGDRISPLVSN